MDLNAQAARLAELRDQILELADKDGDLDDNDNKRYGELNTEFDELRATHDADWTRAAEYAARDEALRSFKAGDFEDGGGTRQTPAFHRSDIDPFDRSYRSQVGDHEAAKRAVEQLPGERAQHDAAKKLSQIDTPEMRQIARHVLAFGSPDYARAFGKASLGQEAEMTDAERGAWAFARTEARAMGLTDAAGGYAIPVHLDPSIIDTRDGTINPFRAISTVVSVTGDTWNGVTSAGVTVAYGTEFAVASDGSPVFTQPTITPAKGQGFVPISIEGYEDIAGVGTSIAQMFANARDDLDATKMATGSGTNEPKGVVTALAAQVLSQDFNATNSAISAADLFDIQTATGPKYRSRGSWVMNMAYINRIRALGSSDNYFAQSVRLPEAAFSSLLGRPLYEASGLTSVLSTTTNNWAVFGDFSNYVIVDRVGTMVEFIPHLFDPTTGRPNGSRGWYMHWRTGADVVNTTAFTLGVNPNTAFV